MNTSLFELFKIGIGPSSSHTVGPMRAALRFVRTLDNSSLLAATTSITVELYGSLALTGVGHGTDGAVLLGLLGEAPDKVDPAQINSLIAAVRSSQQLRLFGHHQIVFRESEQLLFHRNQMYPAPETVTHPNGLRFTARDTNGDTLLSEVYYSIGGGFIVSAEEFAHPGDAKKREVPYTFSSAEQLLKLASEHQLSIAEIVLANEVALLNEKTIVRPPPRDAEIGRAHV